MSQFPMGPTPDQTPDLLPPTQVGTYYGGRRGGPRPIPPRIQRTLNRNDRRQERLMPSVPPGITTGPNPLPPLPPIPPTTNPFTGMGQGGPFAPNPDERLQNSLRDLGQTWDYLGSGDPRPRQPPISLPPALPPAVNQALQGVGQFMGRNTRVPPSTGPRSDMWRAVGGIMDSPAWQSAVERGNPSPPPRLGSPGRPR